MANNFLVFQSDFGILKGSVSQMYGISFQVDQDLRLYDITHNIIQFDTWQASYSLYQSCYAWPKGTVFVSVVDPGFGKHKKRVVALTKAGHYIVTPDNGTLTHLNRHIGIVEVREIDESINRIKGSESSDLFLGRDVYAYTGARLASGKIDFEGVGPVLEMGKIDFFRLSEPKIIGNEIIGALDMIDIHFGNLWSNIPSEYLGKIGVEHNTFLDIIIYHHRKQMYKKTILFGKSFTSVKKGEDLIYTNAIKNLAIGTSLGNFAENYQLQAGNGWSISIIKPNKK